MTFISTAWFYSRLIPAVTDTKARPVPFIQDIRHSILLTIPPASRCYKCRGRGWKSLAQKCLCEQLPSSMWFLQLNPRQNMPRMKEVAGQHGIPHEHSLFSPLLVPASSQQSSQLCFFHQPHVGGRAWKTEGNVNGILLENNQQQWLPKENLLHFFTQIMRKQRQSSHQVQKSGSGGQNHIPSIPYMLTEKSTHCFSLAFPPPHREGWWLLKSTPQSVHIGAVLWDQRSSGSAVR